MVGVWFDLVTMGLFFLPFVAVYFAPIPIKWGNALIVRWIKNFLFITTQGVIISEEGRLVCYIECILLIRLI